MGMAFRKGTSRGPGPTGPPAADLTARESSSDLKRRLVGGASGTSGLTVFYTGLLFLTTMVLTRSLGASDYGVFATVAAAVALVGVVAAPGVERLLTRDIAVYCAKGENGLARGLLRMSNIAVVVLSLSISLVAGFAFWLNNGRAMTPLVVAFWVGFTMIPLNALSRTRAAALIGLRRVMTAQLPELVVRPVLFLGLVIFTRYQFHSLTVLDAVALSAVASAVAFVTGAYLMHRDTPQQIRRASPSYDTRAWRRSAALFFAISATTVVSAQIGVVLLGALSTSANAGLFAVAARGAGIILLGITAASTVIAPSAARLWAQGDVTRLQQIVTMSVRAAAAFAVPVTVVLFVFGDFFLSLFGSEFVGATLALRILCVGQLATSFTLSVTQLLLMAGEERSTAIAFGIGAILNIVFDVALIPIWGLEGAAVGATASLIASEVLLVWAVRTRLGVRLTVVGRIKKVD
jgi:O-antigen/teichoic acid export membrane protein